MVLSWAPCALVASIHPLGASGAETLLALPEHPQPLPVIPGTLLALTGTLLAGVAVTPGT